MRLPRFLRRRIRCPECGTKQGKAYYCEACGYELVEETKDEALPRRLV